jgi:hypothetical protein
MDATVSILASDQSGDAPMVGPTITGFLDRVAPAPSRETLLSNSVSILQKCAVSAAVPSGKTGLIVGRVQSGKTLSYESVIALARDSGFALIVVISGISNPLLDQGVRRLRRDLTEADRDGWNFLINPSVEPQVESTLRSVRDNWADPTTPQQLKKTAVCLLLKNHGRIDAFKELCTQIGWAGQKVLVIDDEADQASLNVSFRRGRQSATYRNILSLREAFPSHAYLQYTATPQAPLLISIVDALSPDFVRVLEPGADYVGGSDYFGSANGLVQVIPDNDLVMAADANGPPPPTLSSALREFILGAADVLVAQRLETRSMLVHPSRLTAPHATFVRWIRSITSHWRSVLEHGDEDEVLALQDEFQIAWTSLQSTYSEIASFDSCWDHLRFVLRNLQLIEMNTRDNPGTPVIDWDPSKAYVLVGGQALDRGFTVDGLSVTYMSRDPGTWTADTVQQRARFFGYKRSYLGLCRVYLEPGLRDAFEMYVQHEAHMLKSLREIQDGKSSLKDWKRHFYIDPAMRPTRQSVVSLPTVRVSPGERWIFDPRAPAVGESASDSQALANSTLASKFISPNLYGDPQAILSMSDLLAFLEGLPQRAGATLPQTTALKLQIARLVDDAPNEEALVINMRPDSGSVRTLTASGSLQPFQGRSNSYPGDRMIFDPNRLTVQLHSFDVRRTKDSPAFASMMLVAVRVPESLADGWLVEEELA